MRSLSLLGLAFLAACDNGLGQFGIDDTAVFGDGDSEVDTGDVDTSDVDTDDVDTDPDTDTGITGVAGDCHPFDPLDTTGWTRTYAVNWEGTEGTETQTGLGQQTAPDGALAFAVQSDLNLGADGSLTITSYRRCENGEMLEVGRETVGSISSSGGIFDSILGDLANDPLLGPLLQGLLGGAVDVDSEQRMTGEPVILPAANAINSGEPTYSHQLMTIDYAAAAAAAAGSPPPGATPPNCKSDPAVAENDAVCIPITTELLLAGGNNTTTTAGTFSTQRIVVTRNEGWSSAGSSTGTGGPFDAILADLLGGLLGGLGIGGTSDQVIVSDEYYSEGIGLVRQLSYNMTADPNIAPTDDQLVISRELISYSGL